VRGERRAGPGAPTLALPTAIVLLVLTGTAAAFVSDWFVDACSPRSANSTSRKRFAGLVIVAIAGNAVENATGVSMAARGRSDLAVSVVVHSVAQIAAFLFPLLILISFAFGTHLTFTCRRSTSARSRSVRSRSGR